MRNEIPARYATFSYLHPPQLTPHPQMNHEPSPRCHYLIMTETVDKNDHRENDDEGYNQGKEDGTRTSPTPQAAAGKATTRGTTHPPLTTTAPPPTAMSNCSWGGNGEQWGGRGDGYHNCGL